MGLDRLMTELRTPSQRAGPGCLNIVLVLFLYIVPVMALVAIPLGHVLAEKYVISMRPDVQAIEMGKNGFVFILKHGQRGNVPFTTYPLAFAIYVAVLGAILICAVGLLSLVAPGWIPRRSASRPAKNG
jgi:hypothetical protein